MAFRWRADNGPHIMAFGSSLKLKTKIVKNSPLTKLLDPRMQKYMVSISLDKQALRA